MLGLVLLLACVVLFVGASRSFVIVNAWEQGVIFRYGRFIKKMAPGFNIILPFIDVVAVIDMRMRSIDVPHQKVITKDNAIVNIDAIIYYTPLDAEKLILNIAEFDRATVAIAQTTMRAIIGEFILDNLNSEREKINARLVQDVAKFAQSWGMNIISVEINEVQMTSEELYFAIAMEVKAERLRRAAVLESEGEKASTILRAQGECEMIKMIADGKATAKVIMADGESKAIRIVAKEALGISGNALSLWELGLWKDMSSGKESNVLLPYNIKEFMKCMKGVGGR